MQKCRNKRKSIYQEGNTQIPLKPEVKVIWVIGHLIYLGRDHWQEAHTMPQKDQLNGSGMKFIFKDEDASAINDDPPLDPLHAFTKPPLPFR